MTMIAAATCAPWDTCMWAHLASRFVEHDKQLRDLIPSLAIVFTPEESLEWCHNGQREN